MFQRWNTALAWVWGVQTLDWSKLLSQGLPLTVSCSVNLAIALKRSPAGGLDLPYGASQRHNRWAGYPRLSGAGIMGVNCGTAGLANIVRAVRFSMALVISLFILFGLVSCGEKDSQGENAGQEDRSQEEYQTSLLPTSGTAEQQAIQWHPVTRWPSDAEYEGMAGMLFNDIVRNEPVIGGARIVENAIAVSPDNSVIAVGTERGWVEFIDAKTGDLLYILITLTRTFGPPPGAITSLAFFEDHLVATADGTGLITFSDLDTLTVRFAETCDGRAGLAVDPIDHVYLYLTIDSIVIRDFYTGGLVRRIECFDDGPIVKSLQQPILAMRGATGGVKLWNTDTGEPVFLVRGTNEEAGFTYDSTGIPLPIWKTEIVQGGTKDYQIETLVVPSVGDRSFALSRTGKWLAVAEVTDQAGTQFVLRVWLIDYSAHNTKVIQMRIPYLPQTPRVSALAISPSDRFCAIGYGPSFDNQYYVDVWDIAREETVDEFTVPSRPITLKFMDDDKLITIRADSVVEQRYIIKDGETLWKYSLCLDSGLSIDERLNWAYSPDGGLIATASQGNLRVWDTNLRRPLWEVNAGPDQEFQLPAFSSDNKYVATVVNRLSNNQCSALIIADSSSGRMLCSHNLESQSIEPTALIFSRDDNKLFIAAEDEYGSSKLLVIDRNSGIERVLPIGQDEYYRIVQDDNDSAVLYLLSGRTINAFDLSSENVLWTRSCKEQPTVVDAYEGRLLVTYRASVGLNVEVLDARTGQPIAELPTVNRGQGFNFRKGNLRVSSLGVIRGMFFTGNGMDEVVAITDRALIVCSLWDGEIRFSYPRLFSDRTLHYYYIKNQDHWLSINPVHPQLSLAEDRKKLALLVHGNLIYTLPVPGT